jgi:fructose-bisphosphate aldolase class II
MNRLKQLRSHVNGKVRVVLHGTNGFKPELMKQCISEGVSKINVNKLVLDYYFEHLTKSVGKIPHTALMEQGVEKVARQTIEWMDMCGSAGKA